MHHIRLKYITKGDFPAEDEATLFPFGARYLNIDHAGAPRRRRRRSGTYSTDTTFVCLSVHGEYATKSDRDRFTTESVGLMLCQSESKRHPFDIFPLAESDTHNHDNNRISHPTETRRNSAALERNLN